MPKQTLIIAIIVLGIAGVWWLASGLPSRSNRNTNQLGNLPVQTAGNPELILTEYGFAPAEFTVGLSQTIEVKLSNRGKETHAFAFTSLDFRSNDIPAGESITVRFTTPSTPGRYDFVCSQPGHADHGMRGTMIVQ